MSFFRGKKPSKLLSEISSLIFFKVFKWAGSQVQELNKLSKLANMFIKIFKKLRQKWNQQKF